MPYKRHAPTSLAVVLALAFGQAGCAAQPLVSSDRSRAANAHTVADAGQGSAGDAELMPFVPKGRRLGLSARGDLDADGDEDALLVLDDGNEAARDRPRPLVVLRRSADGSLHAVAQSPRAIACRRCGGMAGDPLRSIRIESGGFVLRFEGGSRELWSSEFAFRYSSRTETWQLRGVEYSGFDRAQGRQARRALTQEEIGDVTLADFDASEFPADALP